MELRSYTPRGDGSKETLENTKDTVITYQVRGENLYPNLQPCTDGETFHENEIVKEDKDDLMSPFLQYARRVPVSVLLILLSTLMIFIVHGQVVFFECSTENSIFNCEDPFHELYQLYPQHENLWKAMNTTLKICKRTTRPGVILLLHNGNGSIANCLVNRTAITISKVLAVNKTEEYVCSVDGRNAHLVYEKNSFLTEIFNQRENVGIVVFRYLEKMDLELVKNLHFICDTDPNIPHKAVIILVLAVETQTFRDQNLDDLAHKKLAELWEEQLGPRYLPIIGRIANNIASIDESINTECP